jgi:hypothetical protein
VAQVDCLAREGSSVKTVFGPFADIPAKSIHPAGFDCPVCKNPVCRFGAVVPNLIPRVMIYACGCGKSICCWEDELQPGGPEHWAENLALARAKDVEVLVFNGGKDTPSDLSRTN